MRLQKKQLMDSVFLTLVTKTQPGTTQKHGLFQKFLDLANKQENSTLLLKTLAISKMIL